MVKKKWELVDYQDYKRDDINFRMIVHKLIQRCLDAKQMGIAELYKDAVLNLQDTLCPYWSKEYIAEKEALDAVKLPTEIGELIKDKVAISKLHDYEARSILDRHKHDLIMAKESRRYRALIILADIRNLLLEQETSLEVGRKKK